jgi:flagellar biosynthesis anti-sigma factor FlgM
MRIEPKPGSAITNDAAHQTSSGSNAVSISRRGAGHDQATFSPEVARVRELAAQANSFTEIRAERVAAISSAMRQGTYQVSPEQTAEGILAEAEARGSAAA